MSYIFLGVYHIMSSSTSYSMRLIVKSKGEIDPGVWILRVEASGSGLTSSIILY